MACAAIAFPHLLLTSVFAQAAPEKLSKPIIKCWGISTSVIAEAGLAADNTQGYFVNADGRLVAVNLRTGEIGWTAEFGGQPVSEILLSSASVIVNRRSGTWRS